MVIKQVELQHVCGITSKLPDTGQVEVAFAGKSNVENLLSSMPDESEITGAYQCAAGKNTDDQLLPHQ